MSISFTMQSSALTPEAYLNSRRKDYNDLLLEIGQSKGGDLGYCKFSSPTCLEISGSIHQFDSNCHAKAFILRRFW